MIYSPFISWLANQPITCLVTPASEQENDEQTSCFCPFCKQERVGEGNGVNKQNRGGSETPHFIIYKEKGGLYDGGAQKWMCTRTGRKGYGIIELWAQMRGYALSGDNLLHACRTLLEKLGFSSDTINTHFFFENPFRDKERQYESASQDVFTFQRRADLTPQEMLALGCEARIDKGAVSTSWGDFDAKRLHTDFRTYALVKATLPATYHRGRMGKESETIYGTPWQPLFITFATPDEDCGCIWRPTTDLPPVVFSNNEDISVAKVSKWLGGDRTFLLATEKRDSKTTGVYNAIKEVDEGEIYETEKETWICDERNPDKQVPSMTTILNSEIKARQIVLCHCPQDAIATYYTLRHFRSCHSENATVKDECWYHVAFLLGRGKFWYIDHGEWKEDKAVEFGNVQHNKLARFADNIILIYPQNRKAQILACAIARKYRDVSLALLPDSFRLANHRKVQRMFGHEPDSVRDFILCYQMTDNEAFKCDRDLKRKFYDVIKSAMRTCPLIRTEKRDRNGNVKEITYAVNPATVWHFMMCEGYFRAIDMETEDRIGQFVHRDGPFVEPINKESMVATVLNCLAQYAVEVSRNQKEHEKMLQGIACANKVVNQQTIVQLPTTTLNYEGAYSADFDHFFYKNGALRITKDEIRLVPYSDITFDIDRRAVRPFSFRMPLSQPFSIYENPEAIKRRDEIERKKKEVDENGVPVYSTRQLSQMTAEYTEWCRTYRWKVNWQGKREVDMWKTLRVLRGFANVNWQLEEECLRDGKSLSDAEQAELDARFANFIFVCGVCCWRFHGSATNCAPYLMENSVADNKKASGGSGKSTLANIFMSSARNVLAIDCKKMDSPKDMRFSFADYRPNVDTIIHWEDLPRSFSLQYVYNCVTSGFQYERKHMDAQREKLAVSPVHVLSSNYPMSDVENSTLRRFVIVPFSDRFCGENSMLNKPARNISDVMKDFTQLGIEYLSPTSQSQMAYMMALGVQFCMRYNCIVNAPQKDVKHRQMVSQLTDSFVRWAEYFFSRPEVYGHVLDLRSMWEEYKRDYTDASKAKQDSFALSAFKTRCDEYCQFVGVTMNPPHLFATKRAQEQKCFQLRCWVTKEYFTGRDWEGDPTIHPKYIRVSDRTEQGAVFYRMSDNVPASYQVLKEQQTAYMEQPDPLPICDEEGNPIVLTTEEKQRWEEYIARKQRRSSISVAAPQTAVTVKEDDLPF